MPTITIDGKTLEVANGTRLIDAAADAGIYIPHFCYHPGLSVAGNCRMCEVEVEGAPKLEPSCNTICRDGMVVFTDSERVRKTRAAVLEMLLIHHPIDCPICDQAGECKLQDYYMLHGLGKGRFPLEEKLAEPKMIALGRNIMLDNERCVNCTSCVRFSDEISGEAELGMFERGDNSRIATVDDRALVSRYAGNLVEVCPVGALTDADFRFRRRVWFLTPTNSVCDGCARGCSIQVHHEANPVYKKDQSTRIYRYRPRYNPRVNDYWMCDEGRYSYKQHDAPERLLVPRLSGGDEVSWEDALRKIVDSLGSARRVDVIFASDRTCEELQALRKVLGGLLEARQISCSSSDQGESDNYLMLADHTPNRRGAAELGLIGADQENQLQNLLDAAAAGETDVLFVFGGDLTTGDLNIQRAMAGAALSVYVGTHANRNSELADLVLPRATHVEQDGTFVNAQGLIQRLHRCVEPLGEARADWDWLSDLAGLLGKPTQATNAAGWFGDISAELPFFAGLSWAEIDPLGNPGKGLESPTAPTPPGRAQMQEALQ